MASEGKVIKGVGATFAELYAAQGVAGFYRGLEANIMRAMMLNGGGDGGGGGRGFVAASRHGAQRCAGRCRPLFRPLPYHPLVLLPPPHPLLLPLQAPRWAATTRSSTRSSSWTSSRRRASCVLAAAAAVWHAAPQFLLPPFPPHQATTFISAFGAGFFVSDPPPHLRARSARNPLQPRCPRPPCLR